jgi:hypothetical protein
MNLHAATLREMVLEGGQSTRQDLSDDARGSASG